ncbi:hypothetical protein ACTHQ4_20540 [Alkalicoccobacillus gibsonii]|uniref:hypothetical protein n=1 Tax=Alkalicoccobacillus gibsonii TaxID=79881 RepID=UPI003F7C4F95
MGGLRGRGGLGKESRALAKVGEVLVMSRWGLGNRGSILITDALTLITDPAS